MSIPIRAIRIAQYPWNTMKEIEGLVILNNIHQLGPIKTRRLIEHFSSALSVLEADAIAIAQVPGFHSSLIHSLTTWREQDYWKKDLELIEKCRLQLISYKDEKYPTALKQIDDRPILLYLKGSIMESDRQSLAIIGTRNCTPYGAKLTEDFSADLAQMGFTVVSGLARGIDTAAHRGALKMGRTIAVIGSGLNHIYPRENISLAAIIEEHGAIISELPAYAPPDKRHFPRRNRIVSGISLGIVMMEAPIKSGAMITMEHGMSQGRKLFTFPSRGDMDSYQGNRHLIINGQAKVVESAKDIANFFT